MCCQIMYILVMDILVFTLKIINDLEADVNNMTEGALQRLTFVWRRGCHWHVTSEKSNGFYCILPHVMPY